MNVLKKILSVVKIILIVFLIGFIICFGSIVYQKKVLKSSMPNLFGYAGGTIVSGSMEPNIKIGDFASATSLKYLLDILYAGIFSFHYKENLEQKIVLASLADDKHSDYEYINEK